MYVRATTLSEFLDILSVAGEKAEGKIVVGSKADKIFLTSHSGSLVNEVENIFGHEADDSDVLSVDASGRSVWQEDFAEGDVVDIIDAGGFIPRDYKISIDEFLEKYIVRSDIPDTGVKGIYTPSGEFAVFKRLHYFKIADPAYKMQPLYIKHLSEAGLDMDLLAALFLKRKGLRKPEAIREAVIGHIKRALEPRGNSLNSLAGTLVDGEFLHFMDKNLESLLSEVEIYAERASFYDVIYATKLLRVLESVKPTPEAAAGSFRRAAEKNYGMSRSMKDAYFAFARASHSPEYFSDFERFFDEHDFQLAEIVSYGFSYLSHIRDNALLSAACKSLLKELESVESPEEAALLRNRAAFAKMLSGMLSTEQAGRSLYELSVPFRNEVEKLGSIAKKPVKYLSEREKQHIIREAFSVRPSSIFYRDDFSGSEFYDI